MGDNMDNASNIMEEGPPEIPCEVSPEASKQDQEYPITDARIKELLKNELLCCELLWSFFVAAARSYRFSSILRPFPLMYKNGEDKNMFALKNAISRVPPLSTSPDTFWSALPNECQDLIAWTLSAGQFQLKLKEKIPTFALIRDLTGQIMETPEPNFVYEVLPSVDADRKFEELREGRKTFYAYHGSRLDNFFSILHLGLNTHLNKVSVFGEGTYLSSELSVSLMYSQAGEGWKHSCLGGRLSCVAVCEMIDDPSVKCQTNEGTAAKQKSRAQASKDADSVPEKYYVVQRNDIIRLKYLLIYRENDIQPQVTASSSSLSWLRNYKFPLLMLVYALLLLVIGLANSRSANNAFKRFFKQLTT